MSELNIREIAAKFNGTVWDGTHVGALAADWLRLTATLGGEKFAEIEAREKAATDGIAGPAGNAHWYCGYTEDIEGHAMYPVYRDGECSVETVGYLYSQDDAEFTAHARTDIPALLQEIRRLTTSHCQCFYGGYQPAPIQCGLDVHTGQHAGIGDNEETVIWPEAGVSNGGPGKPLYCETCGMTGKVRR